MCSGRPDPEALSAARPIDEPVREERTPLQLTEQARRVHRAALVIDGHNDLPNQLRKAADPVFQSRDLAQPQRGLHTDIPRLRQGGVGAQFWSAWVPTSTANEKCAVRRTLEQLDLIHRMVRQYPATFEMAFTASDVVRARKRGRIASLLGVEGGHSVDNSLAVLRTYRALGMRYLTLTHAENTDWADSATDQPKHRGLTEFGEEVVLELNRLAVLVDISHVSADTMRHVLTVTRAPVIASHSSAYALSPQPRNIPDDVLRLVAQNGGIVMVNFYSGFVVPEGEAATKEIARALHELHARHPNAARFDVALGKWRRKHRELAGTVGTVVDHIEHIATVAGVEHVGLGSDFDGVNLMPAQLEDVSCFPHVTQELLNRGRQPDEIHKILGENILRAMRGAENVARRMNR